MALRYKNTSKVLALMLGGLTVAASGHAEEMVLALGEQDFFAELPVILTATRLPQPVADAPAAVTIIDRQMIEAAGVADIPSLFRLVAGFQVAHDRDARSSVTYHGASDAYARRMQVLVDGRSIYTPITGGVDWVDLPVSLEDIERIEVTRGPNGVVYGANSFLGVINIITFHPAEVRGFSFKTTLGDENFRKGTLRYAGTSGALDYRVTVERREDNGFYDYDHGADVLDGQRTTALTLRSDYRATVNDYLTLQLGQGGGPRQRGYADDITDPQRWQDSHGDFQQLRWKHIRSTAEEFSVQLYRNHQKHADSYVISYPNPYYPFLDPRAVIPIAVNNDIEMERYNLEVEHMFAPAADWRLVWGAEARLDRSRADGYLGTSRTFEHEMYRLSGNGEWRPDERWTANIGALVEHNEGRGTQTSPRLALNYKLPGGRYLRASYTEAYRTPAIFEEKANHAARLAEDFLPLGEAGDSVDQLYYSAEQLDSEHMTAYELAFGGATLEQRVSYEVKLFHEQMRDLISLYRDPDYSPTDLGDPGVWLYRTEGEAMIRGIELQARLQPTEQSLISIAYSHAQASGYMLRSVSEDTVSPPVYTYTEMSETTPENTLSLLLANTFPGDWRASLGVYHVTICQMAGWPDDQLHHGRLHPAQAVARPRGGRVGVLYGAGFSRHLF